MISLERRIKYARFSVTSRSLLAFKGIHMFPLYASAIHPLTEDKIFLVSQYVNNYKEE
jgi:hypothetical protein